MVEGHNILELPTLELLQLFCFTNIKFLNGGGKHVPYLHYAGTQRARRGHGTLGYVLPQALGGGTRVSLVSGTGATGWGALGGHCHRIQTKCSDT